MHFSE